MLGWAPSFGSFGGGQWGRGGRKERTRSTGYTHSNGEAEQRPGWQHRESLSRKESFMVHILTGVPFLLHVPSAAFLSRVLCFPAF